MLRRPIASVFLGTIAACCSCRFRFQLWFFQVCWVNSCNPHPCSLLGGRHCTCGVLCQSFARWFGRRASCRSDGSSYQRQPTETGEERYRLCWDKTVGFSGFVYAHETWPWWSGIYLYTVLSQFFRGLGQPTKIWNCCIPHPCLQGVKMPV